MDRLLLQQAQVDAAGSTPSPLPLPVPGLAGGPPVGTEVVVEELGQLGGILPRYYSKSRWGRRRLDPGNL